MLERNLAFTPAGSRSELASDDWNRGQWPSIYHNATFGP